MKSSRPASGTHINQRVIPLLCRRNKVITLTADIRKAPQAGAIEVINKPRWDGIVIAPENLPENYDFPHKLLNIGQLYMSKTLHFDAQVVNVLATETNPAIVLLSNAEYLNKNLYGKNENGKTVESEETILKRITFFNRAVVSLLRQADIDPRILHLIDWPTTLSLLYLEEKNLPIPKTLFTYPNAVSEGLFDQNLLPILGLTGQRASDLRYSDQISLAQLGLLRSSQVTTWIRGHIDDVIEGRLFKDTDYGGFQRLFRQRIKKGDLTFLYYEREFADGVAGIDMLDPKAGEKDYIFGALLRYSDMYNALVPKVNVSRMPEYALYNSAERTNFAPYVQYSRILKALEEKGEKDVIPPFKALVKGFGSKEALKILRGGTEREKEKFLTSLRELSMDWYNFARITKDTLFEVPGEYQLFEPIAALPVLSSKDEIKETGLKALKGKEGSPYSDLFVVTMSGGLGQRLRYAIQISSDVLVKQLDLSKNEIELLKELEDNKKINLGFGSKGDIVWHIPQHIADELGFISSLEFTHQRMIKIPRQILGEAENEFFTRSGIHSAKDGKQDETWFIPVEDFKKIAADLSKTSNEFVKTFLDQIEEKLAGGERISFVNIPKGTYKLPGSKESLFETQARSLAKLENKIGKKIMWGIMLSHDNQEAVERFFDSNLKNGKYFGILDQDQIIFETQGNNPVVIITDKKEQKFDLVIDPSGEIVADANGHGGFHDVANRMLNRLDHEPSFILGCNIENVLLNLQLGNLDFMASWMGQHVGGDFDVTGLASEKSNPTEKMGIFARADHVAQVIEYNHPSFTSIEAFAYRTSKDIIYFAKDPEGNILIVPQGSLKNIFKETDPPGKGNISDEINNLRSGFELLELDQIPPDQNLFHVDNNLQFTGQNSNLADLGQIKLEYRQGNTNIFIFNRKIIKMVVDNPSIMRREEHKQGSHRHGIKIESSIFGPLALARDFEALQGVDYTNVGFVEEERCNCFEPIKGPADVGKVKKALDDLLERSPGLK